MKVKKISLLLVLVLVVTSLFTACSDGSDTENEEETGSSKNAVYTLNETAVLENTKITAKQFKEVEASGYFGPGLGKKFVAVEFEIENIGDEDISVSSMLNFNAYEDDVKLEYSIDASIAVDNSIDGVLAPGEKMTGWYAMEVFEHCEKIEVQYIEDFYSDSPKNFATFIFKA